MAFAEVLAWLHRTWQTVFSAFLTRIIIAIIILLVGFIIGRIMGKLTQRFFHELEFDALVRKTTKMRISAEALLGNMLAYFIYFVTIVMALNQLGLTTTVLYLISAGMIVIIVLSVFLGIKDFIPNLMAGMILNKNKLITVGDHIKFKNIEGKVKDMSIVETTILTKSGDLIFVPNANLIKSEIIKIRKKR